MCHNQLMKWQALNWKEIAELVAIANHSLDGSVFAERVIVPERPDYPGGFIKGEWALRFQQAKKDWTLLFSVQPRFCYFCLLPGKGPKAAKEGSRSGFDLSLGKLVKGARLSGVEAVEKERLVIFWFSSGADGEDGRWGLVLRLIPATPEAMVIRDQINTELESNTTAVRDTGESYRVLASTRNRPSDIFEIPAIELRHAPADLPVRDLTHWNREVHEARRNEAFDLRLRAVQKEVRARLKYVTDRHSLHTVQLREAEREPDWQKYGTLLVGVMEEAPPLEKLPGPGAEKWIRRAYDFETQEYLELPADPKLSAKAQVEKFFHLAKRKTRRISESRQRKEELTEEKSRLELLKETVDQAVPSFENWAKLADWESKLGLIEVGTATPTQKKPLPTVGKRFVSKDGLPIYVGRTKDENLEITFRVAKGNDIWLHLRGRPSAHIVVLVPQSKSAPLETLLDACQLMIHYSGGERPGKCEIDYTFRKYVKRIKNSSEVSYTQNKTLIVQPDATRLKRLLDSGV